MGDIMKKLKITIDGVEKNKSEIVYNNVINNMNDNKLSKDKQIEYLKERINYLETSIKNKIHLGLIISINSIIFALGLLFMVIDIFVLGFIFCILSFIVVILLMYFNKNVKPEIDNEFDSAEKLRKSLNSKLK